MTTVRIRVDGPLPHPRQGLAYRPSHPYRSPSGAPSAMVERATGGAFAQARGWGLSLADAAEHAVSVGTLAKSEKTR